MTRIPTVFPHATQRNKPERRRLSRQPIAAAQCVPSTEASQGSGDESGPMASNDETARTFNWSTVVQHEHSYGLPAECNKELKKIIFDQRADLLILQEQLEEARATIESLRTKGRELEVQFSKTLDELRRSNEKWESQLRFLQRDHTKLKERLRERPQEFQYATLIQDPKKLKYYTGFATPELLEGFLSFLRPHIERLHYWKMKPPATESARKFALVMEDQFLLVMMRLRLGLDGTDLAYRFGVSESTVSRTWITWLDFLYNRLVQVPISMPPALCDKYRPQVFLEKGYATVDGILDCTEVFIETPSSFRVQGETYSTYKKHNTAKGLVMCSPNGVVTFVSDLAPGRLSDKELTASSKVLDSVSPGRSIMADRGFVIEEECRKRSIQLNIPPFMRGKTQLSPEEEQETRQIASVRIHIERVIRRIKTFKILSSIFPNSMASQLNKVWHVCARISNFIERPLLEGMPQASSPVVACPT